MIKKSKVFFILPLLLLSGCKDTSIHVSKENALIVCLDESNIKKENITEENVQEKNGFIVEYNYKDKHYTFRVSEKGIITSRQVEVLEESKEEPVQKEEPKTPEFSKKEKEILSKSLENAGVTEKDVKDISIKQNEDKSYTVVFTINGGNKVTTITDENGNLISNKFE